RTFPSRPSHPTWCAPGGPFTCSALLSYLSQEPDICISRVSRAHPAFLQTSVALSPWPKPRPPSYQIANLLTLRPPRGPKAGSLSITALARFEFEAGKANEGTKILMVEWEDDDVTRSSSDGSWHVSWAGKSTVLPADERPNDSTRFYFFAWTKYHHSSYKNDPRLPSSVKARDSLQLNPLPAIFPPELGATGRAAGKKGVLHTIWAKKRLRVLDEEIRNESRNNVEGVALHMAVQEKEWIEENFGVHARGAESVTISQDFHNPSSAYPATPISPISGRKLTDKLKGLKLQTSEKDLSHSFRNLASLPMHSMPTPDTATSTTPQARTKPAAPEPLRAVAQFPPEALQEAQQSEPTGFASMNSMSTLVRTSSAESGDELFAKALSPRSPDLPRSPFSFA
ncbi:hypothetical protein N7470_004643, partial [Penicillium chermesinum]